MASPWIVEAIDVMAKCFFGCLSSLVHGAPDELRFDCLEHGFDHRIIITIALAAHGRDHVLSFQEPLIIIRTILATAVRVVDQASRRIA